MQPKRAGDKPMKSMRIPSAAEVERLPWTLRSSMGCLMACLAQLLTDTIPPLHAFPVALSFPAIILSAWFLGMMGGLTCTLAEAVLIGLSLAKTQQRFPNGNVPEGVPLAIFLAASALLGWALRRLARQRTQLKTQELRQRLIVAQAEHKLAEERARTSETLRGRDEMLQTALESNGMGLWVQDYEQNISHWSDEVYRIAGREPGSIDPGFDSWSAWLHPEDKEGVKKTLTQARENGKNYQQQYRILWPDGSVRWIESQGRCQCDSEGRVTRMMGVLADVTHRKLTEEVMLRTEKLAVAGRLAAAVAHEINNPLEAVGNLLYLISTAETSEAVRAHARQALDELMRVSLIAQQTLKFHRQPGAPAVTRLSEVVAVVLSLFRPKLRSTGIAAHVRAVREEGVECMPSEMHQVFANLVSNAIDAMPQGGELVIRLRPSRDWRDGRTAGMRVTFSDTGMGMNRTTKRRIFEPFFTTKTDTGTGLGLWVVAQLIERRHGGVRVWSSQRKGGSGTAFSVFLPFGDAASPGSSEATLTTQ
jgi:PAS domain S-box-containing protein